MNVSRIPRLPFLDHSKRLLSHLLTDAVQPSAEVLEIGCGSDSPLVAMLADIVPGAHLHQIDARSEAVAQASRANPTLRVEQLQASDMRSIRSESKQLVVAMSVFDQNADSVLPRISQEIGRVLADDGVAVYIHNEELNLPATASSELMRAGRVMLPSDRWRPNNDLEYCFVRREELRREVLLPGGDVGEIGNYLRAIYPELFGVAQQPTETGYLDVPFLGDADYRAWSRLRREVGAVRERRPTIFCDQSTSDILRRRIEGELFCENYGWQILRSGIFEIRMRVPYSRLFREAPPEPYFVRGVSKFGYSSPTLPEPRADCLQDLNDDPRPNRNLEIMLIAYQYGLVARKR